MIEYHPPIKVYIKPSPGKGLGVFAKYKIFKGEVFEICPLYDLEIEVGTPNQFLYNYRFLFPNSPNPEKNVVVWGYGSLYNHSNNPNADWRDHSTEFAFEYFARKDILIGEEICTWYGDEDYWSSNDRKDIKII
jgi:hypothetical protein